METVLIVEPEWKVVDALKWGIIRMLNNTKCREYTIYLSGKNNFRFKIDPEYKANRKDMERPYHFQNITDYLINCHDAVVCDDIEADDALSIEQSRSLEWDRKYSYISLRNTQSRAVVDLEDVDKGAGYDWYLSNQGYVAANPPLTRKVVYLHRLLVSNPGGIVDHINGNPLHNCKENLRPCSIKEDIRNGKKRKGISKYKGVSYDKSCTKNPWVAGIKVDRERIVLGFFDNEEDAARAYDEAAVKYFGEFASCNFREKADYERPGETIIASVDKDLNQIPGWHYDVVKENLYYVDERDAEISFLKQLLTGDRTDNISGIRGIGPVKADKLAAGQSSADEFSDLIYRMYRDHFGEEQGPIMFDKNWNLLWLLRSKNELAKTLSRATDTTGA